MRVTCMPSERVSSGRRIPLLQITRAAEAKAEALRAAFAGYFQKYDVLLCPGQSDGRPRLTARRNSSLTARQCHGPTLCVRTSPFKLAGLPRALGPVRLQFGEAPDWDSTRFQVAG